MRSGGRVWFAPIPPDPGILLVLIPVLALDVLFAIPLTVELWLPYDIAGIPIFKPGTLYP